MKDRFVRHDLPPEQTKALVFVFVFVLVDEQAISAVLARLVVVKRSFTKFYLKFYRAETKNIIISKHSSLRRLVC